MTHRCPLGCPYCSNPLALEGRADELDTATWARVFDEAAALGVLQVHLSGGEPGARRDLVEITQAAHDAGLYTNLITSAVGITKETLGKLSDAGLDHVQISIQDNEPGSADHIAGYKGAFARKAALAAEVTRLGIPLTVNAVMHRANIDHVGDMVALALELGAKRVEIAHAQYYGWALEEPRRADADARAGRARGDIGREPAQDSSRADRHRRGGAGLLRALSKSLRRRMGTALAQRHAVRQGVALPRGRKHSGAEFWNVREHALADIWDNSPAFMAFRGTDWMQEPCRSCPKAQGGFRRLPLPGLRAHRRRARSRPGVPSLAAPCARGGVGRGARGCGVRLPALIILPA